MLGKHMLPKVVFGLLTLGVVAVLAACSVDESQNNGDNQISVSVNELAAWDFDPNYPMWPRVNDTYTISVCFKKCSVANPTPDWASDKTRVQTALAQTWDAYSGIAFAFTGDCPTSVPSDWMPIELTYDSTSPGTYGGTGTPGKGRRQTCVCGSCQVHFGYGSGYYEFETTAVHEVGHALGLRHERSRPDFPGCDIVEPGGGHVNPDPDEGGPLLTQNWDVCSIMGEWSCCDYRKHDSISWYWLSDLDRTGINVLYPQKLTGRGAGSIGSMNGFYTTSGVVVRTDGSIATDWTANGAHNDVYKTQPAWYARLAGKADVLLGTGLQLPASAFATRQYDSIYFSYTDYWNRANNGSDKVVANSAQHTAILASALIRL